MCPFIKIQHKINQQSIYTFSQVTDAYRIFQQRYHCSSGRLLARENNVVQNVAHAQSLQHRRNGNPVRQNKHRDSEGDILKAQTSTSVLFHMELDSILDWATARILEHSGDAKAKLMVFSFLKPLCSLQGGRFRDHNCNAVEDQASERSCALCSQVLCCLQEISRVKQLYPHQDVANRVVQHYLLSSMNPPCCENPVLQSVQSLGN